MKPHCFHRLTIKADINIFDLHYLINLSYFFLRGEDVFNMTLQTEEVTLPKALHADFHVFHSCR